MSQEMIGGRLILACAALILAVAAGKAQESPAPDEQRFATAGIARAGSTGLLTLVSPTVPPPGTVAASLSYGAAFETDGTNTMLPAGLSFGFAKRMEAFATFTGYRMPGYPNETQSTFGMKANVLFLNEGAQELAITGALHSLSIAGPDSIGDESGTAYSVGLLFSTLLFDECMGYAEAGYAITPENLSSAPGRFIGGAGITYPVLDLFLLTAEASTTSQLSRTSGYAGRVGAKLFLFDHLQVAAGAEGVRLDGTTAVGAFLGIAFSSGHLAVGRGERVQPPELLPEPPPLEELSPTDSSSAPDQLSDGYRESGLIHPGPTGPEARWPEGIRPESLEDFSGEFRHWFLTLSEP